MIGDTNAEQHQGQGGSERIKRSTERDLSAVRSEDLMLKTGSNYHLREVDVVIPDRVKGECNSTAL